jgi:hypothetical protein
MNRREFLGAAGAAVASAAVAKAVADDPFPVNPKRKKGARSVAGFAAPKLDTVRAAFIGVGARGSGHVEQMLLLDGVRVTAICDLYKDWAENAAKRVVEAGQPAPALYTDGPEHFKEMVERDDVDIVFVSTPWREHCRMGVAAMKAGKHAFIEVPMCTTVDECWELVDTAEQTQRHCMMMENVNYGREELLVLNMCRMGVFGDLLHGEAAYIHDLRGQMHEVERGTGSWRTVEYQRRNGNLYPTHGLGPVAHYMNVNRGDRMDYLCSVSSPSMASAEYATKHFPPEHKWNKGKFVCGDINTTLIKTVLGKTIMVQWDEQLPRPYNRLNLLQGTKGVWGGFPNRVVIEGETESTHSWTQGDKLKAIFEKYDHPLWAAVANDPANKGGHGGMDFIMLWRIVHCLRNGEPLDQDVYDGASWSVVGPLSEWSVSHRGTSVDVPDFTRGEWKTMKPLGIVGR